MKAVTRTTTSTKPKVKLNLVGRDEEGLICVSINPYGLFDQLQLLADRLNAGISNAVVVTNSGKGNSPYLLVTAKGQTIGFINLTKHYDGEEPTMDDLFQFTWSIYTPEVFEEDDL